MWPFPMLNLYFLILYFYSYLPQFHQSVEICPAVVDS